MMLTDETIYLVREWGREKGIIGDGGKGTEQSQLAKLMEEVEELKNAIETNDKAEKIDAIGDCTVVLILLADIIGTPLEDCLDSAYNVIKSRTGKIVNGTFVKDK
jgi:NTP pyrophosphatase (non-canonical NTP hydrolase)